MTLKNVCWDLPLTAPSLAARNTEAPHTTDLKYIYKQNAGNSFAVNAMSTSWGDHCGGFSYQIEYVSGGKTPAPTREQLDAFLAFDSTSMTVTVLTTDTAWIGTHVIKIKGTNGASGTAYSTISSA